MALVAAIPNEALNMGTFQSVFASNRHDKVTSQEIREYLATIDGEFDGAKARVYHILYEYADKSADIHKIMEESCSLVTSSTGAGTAFPVLLKAVDNLLEEFLDAYNCNDYGKGVAEFVLRGEPLDLEEYQFLSCS